MKEYKVKVKFYGNPKGSNGQEGTRSIFTYPQENMNEEWQNSISDPSSTRNILKEGHENDDIYAYWKSSEGYYFALIIPTKNRNGRLMLTIFTGKNLVDDGKVIVEALQNLKELVGQENEIIVRKVKNIIEGLEQHLIEDDKFSYNSLVTKKIINAYRVYESQSELPEIFGFPNQENNDSYDRVILVLEDSLNENLPLEVFENITSTIKKNYIISEIPTGVTVVRADRSNCKLQDKDRLYEGDHLKITYEKLGYKSIDKDAYVNSGDETYMFYTGIFVIFKNADEVGIKMRHCITFRVTDNCSNEIKNFIVKCNKKIINSNNENGKNKLYVFSPAEKYSIKIEATNYDSDEFELTNDDFDKGYKSVVLKRLLDEKEFTVYCGKKRLEEIEAKYKKGGDFIKKIEKGYILNVQKRGCSRKEIILWILLCLSVLLNVMLLIQDPPKFLTFDDNKENHIEQNVSIQQDMGEYEDSNNGALRENETNENENIENDVTYMKNEDIWEKGSLKSNKYKNLFDFIRNGQIEEILNKENGAPWFDLNDKTKYNGYWKTIYEYLEMLQKNSNSYSLNKAAWKMKECSNSGIKLSILCRELEKIVNEYKLQVEEPDKLNNNKQSKNNQEDKKQINTIKNKNTVKRPNSSNPN